MGLDACRLLKIDSDGARLETVGSGGETDGGCRVAALHQELCQAIEGRDAELLAVQRVRVKG